MSYDDMIDIIASNDDGPFNPHQDENLIKDDESVLDSADKDTEYTSEFFDEDDEDDDDDLDDDDDDDDDFDTDTDDD